MTSTPVSNIMLQVNMGISTRNEEFLYDPTGTKLSSTGLVG